MGRGRAKAKQTKVARDLKYRTHETDFGALAREMHGGENDSGPAESPDDPPPDEAGDEAGDEYDEWAGHPEPSRD
jgi:hypothetical protein